MELSIIKPEDAITRWIIFSIEADTLIAYFGAIGEIKVIPGLVYACRLGLREADLFDVGISGGWNVYPSKQEAEDAIQEIQQRCPQAASKPMVALCVLAWGFMIAVTEGRSKRGTADYFLLPLGKDESEGKELILQTQKDYRNGLKTIRDVFHDERWGDGDEAL